MSAVYALCACSLGIIARQSVRMDSFRAFGVPCRESWTKQLLSILPRPPYQNHLSLSVPGGQVVHTNSFLDTAEPICFQASCQLLLHFGHQGWPFICKCSVQLHQCSACNTATTSGPWHGSAVYSCTNVAPTPQQPPQDLDMQMQCTAAST